MGWVYTWRIVAGVKNKLSIRNFTKMHFVRESMSVDRVLTAHYIELSIPSWELSSYPLPTVACLLYMLPKSFC